MGGMGMHLPDVGRVLLAEPRLLQASDGHATEAVRCLMMGSPYSSVESSSDWACRLVACPGALVEACMQVLEVDAVTCRKM